LWGLRDSGPYLHDGRAKTLDEAVMWHGGQGAESARRFPALTRVEWLQVQAFLKTLVAPASAGSPEVSLAVEEDARAVQQELQRPRDEAVSRQPTCNL
jgi:Di-haem oxidoreductase, putative peroxidase